MEELGGEAAAEGVLCLCDGKAIAIVLISLGI